MSFQHMNTVNVGITSCSCIMYLQHSDNLHVDFAHSHDLVKPI